LKLHAGGQPDVIVRLAQGSDHAALSRLREALWPTASTDELSRELSAILSGKTPGTLPLVEFVAEASDGSLLGFVEVGLRSHAEGCDPALPVGYVEGWYVADGQRRRGIGKKLLAAAENWARQQGCLEIASDTSPGNEVSQRVHKSLGFAEVERSINFRKALR
jgi:aminoglycoside 6'-N-acetyltransferase I